MKVNEIFFSIQGESSYAGFPCAFVRLTGCNLRCAYCDTRHAYEEGEEKTIGDVVKAILKYPARLVAVTGGEPLLQDETPALISALADKNLSVLVETNGTIFIESVDKRAIIVMDIKCPGSGISDQMLWENIDLLRPQDEIKFVLTDRTDYDWSMEIIKKYGLHEKRIVHMSPAYGILEPKQLASWMLEDGVSVRLQLQLHKHIWPGIERGV